MIDRLKVGDIELYPPYHQLYDHVVGTTIRRHLESMAVRPLDGLLDWTVARALPEPHPVEPLFS